jgi:shikimate dehydrogenase
MTVMQRYVVIGNPVEHSQSPFIHSLFAQQTQQPVQYERLLSPLDSFEQTVAQFQAQGGQGCNVTVPFKQQAFSLATKPSERASLAQAANVLHFQNGEIKADNTDGAGLVQDIEHNAGMALKNKRVLLIGAGGAAAGALSALLQAGPLELVLANRSVNKAQDLTLRHQTLSEKYGCKLSAAPLSNCGQAFDVVINASASSLQGAAIPVAAEVLKMGSLALDMMYGPAAHSFLNWATQHGAVARDGLGMLVEQAALAFSIWRGVLPQTAPVLQAMREKLK